MIFKSHYAKGKGEKELARELYNKCFGRDIKVFMYFASTQYNFALLTRELRELVGNDCQLLGCTTSGELATNSGITKGGVAAVALGDSSMKVESVAIKGISRVPLYHRAEIVEKLEKLGYRNNQESYRDLSGVLLVDGLRLAEEKVLSVINSIFHGKLDLIGGSAGDDLKFDETMVALNGKVLKDSGVFLMIKSSTKIKLYRENIFEPQGITMSITKADERNRKIIEIDGKPAVTRYAELLNINKGQVSDYTLKYPIGRSIGEEVFISSIASVDGNSLGMYAQVFENTKVEILKARNPLEVQKETYKLINEDFDKIYGMLCVNCILRSLQFEGEGNTRAVSEGLKNIGEYGGFVSYGEQYKKQHLNQTLTMLVMGR